MDIHLHCHNPQLEALLRQVNDKIDLILSQQETIMTIAQDLEDEVAAETTVVASVEQVVQNLVDAIKNAGTDQAKLQAVLASAVANKTRLAALVEANTPVPNPTPPPPIVG